ncbi:MAG: ATP synthase F1 subunit epsilon [Chloroflexi bacterium HGW-Chloroflexi-2]|jgi:F-type H+-transporting ATPase subunit epsilon|nr:MAG: ATP synthase F1 subunit epsilon [Chloroflexi bacterium HGW-Chloroflexi-2]
MPIQCDIVSQDRMVYSGEAEMVILPGSEGVMGILPNHSPVLTTFNFGIITVVTKSDRNYFTVAGGIAEVQPNLITVLADAAENVDELDESRAEMAKERAEKLLSETSVGDDSELDALKNALRRSTFRLEAIKRFKRSSKRSLKDN